jgi:predicted transcriptional regulator
MNRKRDRLGVIYDILRVIHDHKNSVRPTPLLRRSNLSSRSFADYHDELIGKGFIKEVTDENGRAYLTLTDKGFLFLEKYKTIKGFIEEFEL